MLEDKIVHQDLSTMSKYLQYWWNFVASFVPRKISPNMITLTGGFFMILSAFLSLLSISPWMSLIHALCIFIFQTLDAIDGIHARKHDLCSKLGNYIDHATDVFAIQIMFQVLFYCVGLDGHYLVITTLFINFNIFLAHWETANTGIFHFPNGFSITELQCLCIVGHLVLFFIPEFGMYELFYFNIAQLISIAIIFSDLIFLTIPLLKKVWKKRGPEAIKMLVPISIITFALFVWSIGNEIERFYFVIHLNLPYTVLISEFILGYLRLLDNSENLLVSIHVLFLVLIELFVPVPQQIIKYGAYIFLGLAIESYYDSIVKVANKYDVSILLNRNMKKEE